MAKVSKRGKRWVVRWRDPDGRQRFRVAPDKATADILCRDIQRCHSRGVAWEPEALREKPHVLTAIKAYLEDEARTLKPRTLDRYAEALGYALECWGDIAIEDLTSSHLKALWSWLKRPDTARHGVPRSDDTCKKHLEVAHLWWKATAADERFEDVCPLPRTIDLPKRHRRLPVAPTWAECDAMIAELHVEWHRRVAVLARYTGGRRTELMSLDWSDVNLEEGALRWRPETLKGEVGGRIVPMPPALVVEMAGWGKRVGRVVVAPESETKLGHRGHIDRDIRRAWVRSGVRAEAFKGQPLHCFRKTIETELRSAGVAKEVIDRYVGHEDSSTGGQHYADPRWGWAPLSRAVALIPPVAVCTQGVLRVVGEEQEP